MAHYRSRPAECAPTQKSSNEDFTLYVNNLPEELNEDGIKEIFNHYGKVTGHFYRRTASWAYITYANYHEAEDAIKDLNDAPPLYLKVSFAREKQKLDKSQAGKTHVLENAKAQCDNHASANIPSTNTSYTPSKGQGNRLNIFRNVLPPLSSSTCEYTPDDDLLYPYPTDPHTYNPYENNDPYRNTNTLWTRGRVNITQDGKRHVSLGRGYTLYEIPDSNVDIEKQINKVYEKRSSGLYEYGNDTLRHTVGKCQKCLKVTKFTCERCHGFYCSRTCQVDDWPRHRTECQTFPALVAGVDSISLSELNNADQTVQNISSTPLRRPKTCISTSTPTDQNISTTSKEASFNASATAANKTLTSINGTKLRHPHVKTNDQSNGLPTHELRSIMANNASNRSSLQTAQVEIQNNTPLKPGSQKVPSDLQNSGIKQCHDGAQDPFQSVGKFKANKSPNTTASDTLENVANKRPNFNAKDITKMEDDIAFQKQEFLPSTQFTDVRIVVEAGDREYWIQKKADDAALANLMLELQSEAQKLSNVKPNIGQIYAVQYEEMWCRALVVSLNPLKVHYIDYGNDEIIKTENFREVEKFKTIPRFSAKIRLSEKAHQKYKNLSCEDYLSVKMISVDKNKVINIEVQGENELPSLQVDRSNTTSKASSVQGSSKSATTDKMPSSVPKLNSVINTLFAGDEGILEVHAELSNNTYSATLLPNKAINDFEKLLSDLPMICMELVTKSNYRPCLGDLICGQRLDGDWLRGYIVALGDPLKMAIVEEARVMTISKSIICPEQYANICTFGVICTITGADSKLNVTDHCQFKVVASKTKEGQQEVEIELIKDSVKLEGTAKAWTPAPEQKGIQFAELKSGSEVCLTEYHSHNLLFARSLDPVEVERYNYIMQNVEKCAQTAPCLNEPPVVGQMVIAKYINDNHYRALVKKVKDNTAMISYVDFGNVEVTSIKKLKVLSDDLKQLQSCVTKIVLKDVPGDVPMTKEVSDYFTYLVGRETRLVCKFDGIPSTDGVYLHLPNGESVNDKIYTLLTPTWKRDQENDKTCFLMKDLNVVNLGKAGDILDAVVLYSIEDGHRYAMCPVDYDLMMHVFNVMPGLIAKYCDATEYYIPREKELCLARYEDNWCRAVCAVRSETNNTSSVFFIDYGNIESVNHKDIRLMPKDFMTPDALASVCLVINLAPTNKEGEYSPAIQKALSQYVVSNNCVKIKIVNCNTEDGIYDIELPDVREKLIKDGLLSS